jgi:hypothetical protein
MRQTVATSENVVLILLDTLGAPTHPFADKKACDYKTQTDRPNSHPCFVFITLSRVLVYYTGFISHSSE